MNTLSANQKSLVSERIEIGGYLYSKTNHYFPSNEYLEKSKTIKKVINDNRSIIKDITKYYMLTIRNHYQNVEEIYGKLYNFTDTEIIDLSLSLKPVRNTISDMMADVRNYLGYRISFKRYEASKKPYKRMIPIEPERIIRAHKMVMNKQSFLKIEEVLIM